MRSERSYYATEIAVSTMAHDKTSHHGGPQAKIRGGGAWPPAALGRGHIIMGSNIAWPPASSPAPDLEQNPDTKKWAAISDRPM